MLGQPLYQSTMDRCASVAKKSSHKDEKRCTGSLGHRVETQHMCKILPSNSHQPLSQMEEQTSDTP
jgi:hypothetical protein